MKLEPPARLIYLNHAASAWPPGALASSPASLDLLAGPRRAGGRRSAATRIPGAPASGPARPRRLVKANAVRCQIRRTVMFIGTSGRSIPQPRRGEMSLSGGPTGGRAAGPISPLRGWGLPGLDAAINMTLLRSWHRTTNAPPSEAWHEPTNASLVPGAPASGPAGMELLAGPRRAGGRRSVAYRKPRSAGLWPGAARSNSSRLAGPEAGAPGDDVSCVRPPP